MKTITTILMCIIVFLITTALGMADAPVVQDIMVTDVTPVSFSVIWASDTPATPDIRVFTDADGTNDITAQLTIIAHPTRNTDGSIVTSAQNRGVMKVQVSGLNPDTTYFFQTITWSKATPPEVTYYPSSAPMLQVSMPLAVKRTWADGADEIPFSNDLIYMECYLPDGSTPAEGTLLVAMVEGSEYPVTGFVGDGIASPFAYVDLNNVFSSADHKTMALYGGEPITLTKFMGISGSQSEDYFVPRNNQLAEMKAPLIQLPCSGDAEPQDGDVDGLDLAAFAAGLLPGLDLEVFASEFGRTDCP